jgi:hypothetical protein
MRTRMLRYIGHAFAIKYLFVVALGLAWSPAILAQTVTDYTGTYCRPMLGNTPDHNDDASRITYVNGAVKNNSTQDVTVFCPIVKHTSNPGSFGNDQINSIAITSTGNAGFTCTLNVYETAPYYTDGPFLEDSESVVGAGPGTYHVSSSASDYWGDPPQSSGDNSYWAYAELNCTLHAKTAITHYSVDEAGRDQGRRIVPSSYCYPTPNVTNPAEYLRWFSVYNSDPNEPVNTTGGYVESMSFPLGTAFSFDCPLSKLNLAHVQIALGPAIGGQYMGCDLDGNNGTWQGVSHNPPDGLDFPVENLVFSSSGHHRLNCTINTQPANAGQAASQGDAKIVSYRMW